MIINKFIRLLEDFNEFRKVRRSVRAVELSATHKNLILSYNTQYEKELNSLVIRNLSDEMLDGNLSEDYIKGFKSALTWRTSYIATKTKYN